MGTVPSCSYDLKKILLYGKVILNVPKHSMLNDS